MPKDLLLRIKPSRWLLLLYLGLHFAVAYVVMFMNIHYLWRGMILLSLGVHLLLNYYGLKGHLTGRFKNRLNKCLEKNRLQEIHFVQVSAGHSKGYVGYLQWKHGTKQEFELVAAWQFFARCVLLKCRLINHRKSCWYLLLPDSLVNKDHLRKLVLVLRFGQFINSAECIAKQP